MTKTKKPSKPKTKPKPTAIWLANELKCDVSALVVRGMKRKGWAKEDLAKAVSLPPSVIDAIVYARHDNLTIGFIGLLLHVLNMEATLVARWR